jgi:hypothetical protein
MTAFFAASPGQVGALSVVFSGNYYGTEDEFQKVINPFVATLPKVANMTVDALGWIEGLAVFANDNGTISTSQPDRVCSFHLCSLHMR